MVKLTLEGTEIQDFRLHLGVLEFEQIEQYHKMGFKDFSNTYGEGVTGQISILWAAISRFQPQYKRKRDEVEMMVDSYVAGGGDMKKVAEALLAVMKESGAPKEALGNSQGETVTPTSPISQ